MPEISGPVDSYDAMMKKMHEGTSSNVIHEIKCPSPKLMEPVIASIDQESNLNSFAKRTGLKASGVKMTALNGGSE